jgi:hypothetical protein
MEMGTALSAFAHPAALPFEHPAFPKSIKLSAIRSAAANPAHKY